MAYYPSDNPTSLIAWFRMGVGVTSSGGLASAWADQSGNGNDLLQATGTNQPAYDGSAILTFDGIDNFMKCAAFTLNQPVQVSALVNQVSWNGGNDVLFDGNTSFSVSVFQNVATPNIYLYAGSTVAGNTGATVGAFHAVTALFAGASSSLKVDANAETTGNAGANNAAGFTVAKAGGAGGASHTNSAWKEIIIRNVNDATIRANDHQYLIDLDAAVTPVAEFSGTPLTGTEPLSVAFTDLSTNSPNTWAWDFGDGDTDTVQNPTHIYATAGTYTVTLTASNYAGSDAEVKTNYITVSAAATDTAKTGTGGIDPVKGRKRVPFKPTGLVDRPRKEVKEGRKEVSDRVDESRQLEAEIAANLAKEFGDDTRQLEASRQKKIELMSQAQRDLEIGALLRKKIKTQEEELMLLLMMST